MNPESIEKQTDKNIVVTTKGGNKINFKKGEYQIISDTLGNKILSGKGKIYNTTNSSFLKSFEGSISLNEIKTISTCCESTPWLYVTIIGTTFIVGYVAFFAFLYRGLVIGG